MQENQKYTDYPIFLGDFLTFLDVNNKQCLPDHQSVIVQRCIILPSFHFIRALIIRDRKSLQLVYFEREKNVGQDLGSATTVPLMKPKPRLGGYWWVLQFYHS